MKIIEKAFTKGDGIVHCGRTTSTFQNHSSNGKIGFSELAKFDLCAVLKAVSVYVGYVHYHNMRFATEGARIRHNRDRSATTD